jgi:hypothetical protein
MARKLRICQEFGPGMRDLFLTMLLLFLPTFFAFAEERTWTNNEGQTMEATLVSVESDSVVFSTGDREYNYPIANLPSAPW